MSSKERTRSQIAKGAKNKGSKAEREISKVLGLWYYNDPDMFHRVPSSGGLRWKSNVAGTRGDIVPPENINWPFSVEIKNQEKNDWDMHGLLTDKGPILKDWWKQCVTDALECNKIPWLIFTRNNLPYFSLISSSSLDETFLKNRPERCFELFLNKHSKPLILSTLSHILKANDCDKYRDEDQKYQNQKLMKKIIFNIIGIS